MKVEIKITGHSPSYYNTYIAKLLEFTLAVEAYTVNNKSKFMQVPAMIVEVDGEIKIQPLQQDHYEVKVTKISVN